MNIINLEGGSADPPSGYGPDNIWGLGNPEAHRLSKLIIMAVDFSYVNLAQSYVYAQYKSVHSIMQSVRIHFTAESVQSVGAMFRGLCGQLVAVNSLR